MASRRASGIEYELVRSRKRKKTLSLQIKRDGTIVLLVPQRITREEADGFLADKEGWIRRKLKERANSPDPDRERKFLPGEEFLYLGEAYPLEIVGSDSRLPLTLLYGTFCLRCDEADRAPEVFAGWYKLQARRELAERVARYSARTNLVPTGITITSARSRYGSCSHADRLSFSWRILMAPYPVIDYVILHELAHIKEKNHSRRFWDFLETICPDWKKQRCWLKENGHLLRI